MHFDNLSFRDYAPFEVVIFDYVNYRVSSYMKNAPFISLIMRRTLFHTSVFRWTVENVQNIHYELKNGFQYNRFRSSDVQTGRL